MTNVERQRANKTSNTAKHKLFFFLKKKYLSKACVICSKISNYLNFFYETQNWKKNYILLKKVTLKYEVVSLKFLTLLRHKKEGLFCFRCFSNITNSGRNKKNMIFFVNSRFQSQVEWVSIVCILLHNNWLKYFTIWWKATWWLMWVVARLAWLKFFRHLYQFVP